MNNKTKNKSVEKLDDSVTKITLTDDDGGVQKTVFLVGTAHVSANSAEQVKDVITREKPDSICVELDAGRYNTMTNKRQWQDTDLVKVIKNGRAGFMMINLILSHYQQKIADQFGIKTGTEMLTAIDLAHETGANLVLADRDIQVTFNRIWRGASFKEKCKLLWAIFASLFDNEELTEEDLAELKQSDVLNSALSELSGAFSGVKKALVDERDTYLCEKIKSAPGKVVVAVVGAAHVPGILANWDSDHDVASLEAAPPKGKGGKILGWSISIAIILLVIFTLTKNPLNGWEQTRNWLILTMGGAGIGALASLANPVAILTAIVVAPVCAISPVLAAGWFSGLVEAHMRKPKVTDFENLSNDLNSLKGIWHNKITRVLLVVILTNCGCALGNILGGLNIIRIFFHTIFG